MATLADINTLINDSATTDKVRAAVLVAAIAVNFEDAGTQNHAARIAWAKSALIDPQTLAPRATHYFIAAASADGKSLAQIQGLSDTEIQNYVNASVNVLS